MSLFGKKEKKKKITWDLRKDLMRNSYLTGEKVNVTVSDDEFTICIDIDGTKFELTRGQAALIFLSLSEFYLK